MRHTPQGKSTVWNHGKQVTEKFLDLINNNYKDWPRIDSVKWLPEALALPLGYSIQDIETYCLFHDIGKTITWDKEGHFPNHAMASANIWTQLDSRKHIAQWMANDMAIHTCTQEEFAKIPNSHIHRLVGLAEVYANAEMFGGYDSDSFKIKLKKVIRNGKI